MLHKVYPDETRQLTQDGVQVAEYVVSGLEVERERTYQALQDFMAVDPATISDPTLRKTVLALRCLALLSVRLDMLEGL